MSIFNDGILRNQGKGIKQEQLVAIQDILDNFQNGDIIVCATVSIMEKTAALTGTRAIVEETNTMYVYTGTSWLPSGIIAVNDNSKISASGYYTSSNNDITYINSL